MAMTDRQVKENDVVDLLDTIRTSIYFTPTISEYLLNALIKLTARFQQSPQIDRMKAILAQSTRDLNVEIQQRAVEYDNLFRFDEIRMGVVEHMPPPEIREENRVLGEVTHKKGRGAKKGVQIKQSAQKDLLDILGGGDDANELAAGDLPSRGLTKHEELLNDLFGSGPSMNGSSAPAQKQSSVADIMGLFGNTGQSSIQAASPPPAVTIGGVSAIDDLFGRTAEPPSMPQLSHCLSL